MVLDLYRVARGLQLESENFASNVSVLFGTGAPGGDAGDQDAATVGSIYLRTDTGSDNLQLYYKWQDTNAAADWRPTASKEYVDAVAAGLSWREPVLVHDATSYADITAAETAANVADTVDGVTITVGDRILFSNLTTGNDNVYIVSGTSGNWTFTEDVNLATDGDALLVQQGTYAETQWVFDGSAWVQFSSAAGGAELGFIRAFIGKNAAGSEMPDYSSTNIVTDATSLETAIGDIDAGFGTGEITNDGGNWALSDDLLWGAAGTLTITTAFDNVNAAIGDRTYTEDNYVTDGQSVAASINALDVALNDVAVQGLVTQTANVTAITTVDQIPVAQAEWVKWMIMVEEVGTPANRRSAELDVITDGTNVDYNDFARLRLGAAIAGLAYTVDLSGGNVRLRVASTPGVDVTVKRLGFGTFN